MLTKLQSQGGSNAKDLTLSDANHICFWPLWPHLKVDTVFHVEKLRKIRLPNYRTSCEIYSNVNLPKVKKEKSQNAQLKLTSTDTHIFIFYTFSTFSSSGGGPQMYSITDVSRGLKRSAGYSVKPLSSTNSDKSRPPKYLVETNDFRILRSAKDIRQI